MSWPRTFWPTIIAGALLTASAAQAADVAAGTETFQTYCSSCHSADAPPQNKLGPSLLGVVGRKAGSLPGFNYSSAMRAHRKKWTPAALDAYLANPQGVVPGAAMTFRGLSNPAARANVIAWLATRK